MHHQIDPELQTWAKTAFRPAHIEGLREAKAAARTAREHATPSNSDGPRTTPLHPVARAPFFGVDGKTVAIGLGIFGAAFLAGRWWRKTHPGKVTLTSVPPMPGLRLVTSTARELPSWAMTT